MKALHNYEGDISAGGGVYCLRGGLRGGLLFTGPFIIMKGTFRLEGEFVVFLGVIP